MRAIGRAEMNRFPARLPPTAILLFAYFLVSFSLARLAYTFFILFSGHAGPGRYRHASHEIVRQAFRKLQLMFMLWPGRNGHVDGLLSHSKNDAAPSIKARRGDK